MEGAGAVDVQPMLTHDRRCVGDGEWHVDGCIAEQGNLLDKTGKFDLVQAVVALKTAELHKRAPLGEGILQKKITTILAPYCNSKGSHGRDRSGGVWTDVSLAARADCKIFLMWL
jgi:hypothetical protein